MFLIRTFFYMAVWVKMDCCKQEEEKSDNLNWVLSWGWAFILSKNLLVSITTFCSPVLALAAIPNRSAWGGGFKLFILSNDVGSLNPLPCQLLSSFLIALSSPCFPKQSKLASGCVWIHPNLCELFTLAEYTVKLDRRFLQLCCLPL